MLLSDLKRLEATVAKGADMVRVHDVREMVRVCQMSDAIVRKGRR